MASRRFERRKRITASRERVYAELADPARQLGLQPLLVAVRERETETPGVRVFEAVERIGLLGPVAWRNRIVVEVRALDPPARIAFSARAPLGVRVASEFRLASEPDGATAVREWVTIRIPWWLAPAGAWVLGQAVRAQEALLENLGTRLGSGGCGGDPLAGLRAPGPENGK